MKFLIKKRASFLKSVAVDLKLSLMRLRLIKAINSGFKASKYIIIK